MLSELNDLKSLMNALHVPAPADPNDTDLPDLTISTPQLELTGQAQGGSVEIVVESAGAGGPLAALAAASPPN